MNFRTLLLMLTSTACFAVVNTIVKFMDEFHPYQLVFFRSVGALLICYVQIKRAKVRLWGNNKPILLLRGIAGVIALVMFFYVIQGVSFGTAVTLQYLSPIFSSIIGIWMVKERVFPAQWLALLVCFIGVILLKFGDFSLNLFYLILGVVSAALSGLAYNCVSLSKKTDHYLLSVFYFPLVAVPVAGLASIPYWVNPSGWDWLLIVALGVFTQIAQVSMTKALQSDKIAGVTIYHYLGSVFALIVGYFLFDEVPTIIMVTGMLVIVVGIILFFTLKRKSLNS